MNKRHILSAVSSAVVVLACGLPAAQASSLTVPNTFTAGGTISAASMNANFTAVKTAVDDNNTRIGNIENTANYQRRVSGTCTGTTAVQAIGATGGTVTCGPATVNKAGDTMTGTLTVPGIVYSAAKTQYIQLAGGACVHPAGTAATLSQPFYCYMRNDANTAAVAGYWNVNIPNGVTIAGLQMRVFTSSGTTTCSLYYGNNNFGTLIASVTDTTAGWHTSAETAANHVVNTALYSYAVLCSNPTLADNAVGGVRIRYTYSAAP